MLCGMPVLIVGASVSGVRTAQALRMSGYQDGITILGAERHHPYDKPPLSKETLSTGDPDPVPLLSVEDVGALRLDLRLGVEAVALDTDRRIVRTADGNELSFDTLVIATGVIARALPGSEGIAAVHTLRTADDAIAIRSRMAPGGRAVVIGAGFIGAEFASAARSRGMAVTVVEAQDVPMAHVLGPVVGEEIGRLHALNGVALRTGTTVAGLREEAGQVAAVALSDGEELLADVVVVGIGAEPTTGWLESSGLPLADGIVCDRELRVLGADRIYAVGDVARWDSPWGEEPVRIEHWTNANEHAGIVAASITGGIVPRAQVPYVWSDQYGRRIQIVGRPAGSDLAALVGAVDEPECVAVYQDTSGTVTGGLVIDDPRTFMKIRKAVSAGTKAADLDIAPRLTGSPAG